MEKEIRVAVITWSMVEVATNGPRLSTDGFSPSLAIARDTRVEGKPMPFEPTNALLGLAFLLVWALAGQVIASDP